MMGSRSASPRLSPSAISAICCAAKAASQELKVEKIVPAMAVPVSEVNDDKFKVSNGFETVRPLGRFWKERTETGFMVAFVGLSLLGGLMLEHLALRIAIVVMVAAIDAAVV
eukprot:TRINITY_DN16446_c0_g1_i1.p2 TRINITY_DN16446_c0_g1~~TRINITY_DN16446_c0_g1_i1.p2  ORF type:complete len:112 (+),score=14.80 TRINITY_DN16446_c0_g1_i1:343-678(+)